MHGSEIREFDLTPAIHKWFAAGVMRKHPDTVKLLNQDQAHKLTVFFIGRRRRRYLF